MRVRRWKGVDVSKVHAAGVTAFPISVSRLLNVENWSIDSLFYRGFIGFEDSVWLVISPVAHLPSLQRVRIDTCAAVSVGGITEGQRKYLEFHLNSALLKAAPQAG
jgi:hypothetical protein